MTSCQASTLLSPLSFLTKIDNKGSPLTVEIMMLKDLKKKSMEDNTQKKELLAIETFTGGSTSATIIIMLNRIKMEVLSTWASPTTHQHA
jgi:hypothetical protein